ncbi:MAG TPA: iron-containing alcohol dehydrogenase [Granulicella sp.]
MRTISLLQPPLLTYGSGCLAESSHYLVERGFRNIFVLASPSLSGVFSGLVEQLRAGGCTVTVDTSCTSEPTLTMFDEVLARASSTQPVDCVLGIGGGSVLDLAKLIAAFLGSEQNVRECFGIGFLKSRRCHLVCLPSTSGTGSEVSPNAILLDEAEQLKKGVVSRFLVPDATFIDPELTVSLPSQVTAFTGLDALTHCIEAYTNKFAHPLVDLYAREGIRLSAEFLVRAVRNGSDIAAREGMSLASMFGGMCLGPVNTAAVHALAYPLGGEFHIPHGLSNAVLLPSVFRFNAEASPERHAEVAALLGAPAGQTALATALHGADRLEQLIQDCGVSTNLATYGVPKERVPDMARSAATVTRLLKNNPRDLSVADIEAIYLSCYAKPA